MSVLKCSRALEGQVPAASWQQRFEQPDEREFSADREQEQQFIDEDSNGDNMKPKVLIGAVLALLGLLALASPVFTTNQTRNVATLGDIKIQANEQTSHAIPPVLSGAAVIVGLALLASGLYRKGGKIA
ncbi:MAG TPA: hypothetical protein VEU51_13180 [Candidatus Acidoferrales bacterium]|nr:hypothetical protein [Candidatus Acidoferrales bacterium]